MTHTDTMIFVNLFKESYEKCFKHALQSPLTEAESKLFGNAMLDQTGLVIGWKSIKNYSFYVLNETSGKSENPSMATLDTFARYVLNAPYTDEIQRKNKEDHYPYWFQYRNQAYKSLQKSSPQKKFAGKWLLVGGFVVFFAALLLIFDTFSSQKPMRFIDNFNNVEEAALLANGWLLQSKDVAYWQQREERSGCLTLFTLRGDSWSDSANAPNIKNLLLRKINADCFIVEVHLKNFFPQENWQQAGVLLLEDTSFIGKSLRLSLAYNDFSGGFPSNREILLQAITSLGNSYDKPEEIAHKSLFSIEPGQKNLVAQNLENVALRIEKQGKRFRLLYSNGSMENSAFKELISREFDMQVKYIGIFALKGFVNDAENMPVYFDYFSLSADPCPK